MLNTLQILNHPFMHLAEQWILGVITLGLGVLCTYLEKDEREQIGDVGIHHHGLLPVSDFGWAGLVFMVVSVMLLLGGAIGVEIIPDLNIL